ncbi:MAG: nitrous oxide reductase accessory protein NosL [Methylobacter tundripaludum]|nr:nitrous oxide reductase accessory protein NosL [Methylobacter tundripaludum]
MKTVIKIAFMLVVFQFTLMPASVSAEEAHKRESCRVCGMYIDRYQKSAAELVFKDGTTEHTCGVACMLREVEDAGGYSAFKSVKVHDWVTGELVDAQTATYVLGSNVIPDMVPNYIAFAKREEAEAFAAKEGGQVIDFNVAYDDVSPVGTTSPFRVRTAVTPGAGNFSAGTVFGYNDKNQVTLGSNGKDPTQFIQSNPAQPKAPKQFEQMQQALTFNYSPTDKLALFMNVPWFEKRLTTLTQTQPKPVKGKPITAGTFGETVDKEDGIGDITLEGRYNVWRSTRWDKFATVLLGTSLPTGHFDGSRDSSGALQSPALQLGKGTATFRGGLVYSQRWKDFWLHTNAIYDVNPESNSSFAYGDVATAALALHYTPNYNLMVGFEMDATYTEKNTDRGIKVGNSGGTVANLAFVSDYRFLNAFGGNFKLRNSIGFPMYQDLNYQNAKNARGDYQQVQLGSGFFVNASIVWTFRASPYD